MLCPCDKATLAGSGSSAHQFFSCECCHGLWFSRDSLKALLEQPLPKLSGDKTRAVLGNSQKSETLCCPACVTVLLDRKMVDGIEIDICSRCGGIWLDCGELELIWQRHRKQKAKNPRIQRHDSISTVLDVIPADPDFFRCVGQAVVDLCSAAPDMAGEAAGAIAEFLGEALSGL